MLALLRLADVQDMRCVDVKDVPAVNLGKVTTKIADLRTIQRALTALIVQCRARDQSGCPLIETLLGAA